MQRKESVASPRFLAAQFHELWSQPATVREGRQSNRRLHANARRTARHDQVLGPQLLENRIQFSFEKAAEAVLVENDIRRFGREFRNNVCVPGVPHEHPTFATIRRQHDRPHSEELMPRIVGAVHGASIGQISLEPHLQVDHRNPNLPSGNDCPSCWLDSTLDH